MTIAELAEFIRKNKPGWNFPGVHPSRDEGVVLQQTRHEMREFVHISDEHIFECCQKANSYDEHIELCKPIAMIDTEKFRYEMHHRPVPKGRTRRRFR
jgi:hypothetical protein